MNSSQVVEMVKSHIETNRLIEKGDQVIVGLSGGADSVCLLCVLKELFLDEDIDLLAVHINHGIRDSAMRDQLYAKELCERLNVSYVSVEVDAIKEAKERGISTEEAGRLLRYQAFCEYMSTSVPSKIAVAHNMDDNVETVIHNLSRGTGLKGMCGIPVKRDNIIRPILCLRRSEIESYLQEKGISFCLDETNLTDDYTRNKIRHHVITYLSSQINLDAVSNIHDMSQMLTSAEDYLENQTTEVLSKAYHEGVLKKDDFMGLHDYMKTRVIHSILGGLAGTRKDITRIHVGLCLELMDNQVGRGIELPYGIRVNRCYQGLSFLRAKDEADKVDYISESLSMQMRDFSYEMGMSIPDDKYTKWFDYDIISSVISLRTRQPGDYLVVDKLGARKKLKEYFINEKIPSNIREHIPLVADGSHIMWVVGYRISSHYKVTDNTKRILEIKIKRDN